MNRLDNISSYDNDDILDTNAGAIIDDVTDPEKRAAFNYKYSNLGFLRKIIQLIIFLAIPLGIGLLSSILSSDAMSIYSNMNKPPLSPPAMLFPIAWTILYVLMGLASYIIFIAKTDLEIMRFAAIFLYCTQLFFNFLWSIIFFRESQYMGAFAWLLCLWGLVLLMLLAYRKISKAAFYLTIPYLLWLTFAGYLNISIALMN